MEIFADIREDTPIAWKRISYILAAGLREGYWKLEWYVEGGRRERMEEDQLHSGRLTGLVEA
jgi:hypothetical protein